MVDKTQLAYPFLQAEVARIRGEMSWVDTPADTTDVVQRAQLIWKETAENSEELLHPPKLTPILRIVRQVSKRYQSQVQYRDVGTVRQIGNGVATLSGLRQVSIDELVTFTTGVQGMVFTLDHDQVHVILLGKDTGVHGGDLVVATGKRLKFPVGEALVGRVINPIGQPLDGLGPMEPSDYYLLERPAPGIVERIPVTQPLYTGLKIVDALLPIGRGQRELIIGDRQTGKTSLAIDTIIRQKGSKVQCVYVAIGQKRSSTLSVINAFQESGAFEYTTMVVSSPDDPPALRYLAPYAGCSFAEYLTHQLGHDTLVVYDNLTHHADAYRELSLLLRRPPGREAYPGDIFYLHARLLERACQLSPDAGGGSLSALPIVEVQRGNISAYIPTNLISITDGQIVLDSDLFKKGIKPAVDIGRSVSRVGGAAQTPAMRKVAGNIRLELAQYEEVARFARFGTDLEETTQQQIKRGYRLQTLLTQPVHETMSLARQVIVLYTAATKHFEQIQADEVNLFEKHLLTYIDDNYPDLLNRIDIEKKLSQEIKDKLDKALERFMSEFEREDIKQ